jgi:uncharacterized membrane protein YgcG
MMARLRLTKVLARAFFPLAFLTLAGPALAQEERIDNFVSDIVVHPDSTLTVTETITVTSTGDTIKRGIVREFPTIYRSRSGNTVWVGFEVVGVQRDGHREPYHMEGASNGKKVYIGDTDVLIGHGIHVFVLTYRTNRQLGYFDKFDELYWNVTGNGWRLPIDRAEATITLPPGATLLQHAGYTGPQDSQGQNFDFRQDSDGKVIFTTTQPLALHEGLTVAVAWPKGLVSKPTAWQWVRWLLSEDTSLDAAMVGLLLVLAYYLFVWFRVGRDPARGTIIPLFVPPQGLSPAACRFLERRGFDDKAFAAAVVDLAVKGTLTIEEKSGFTLSRRKDAVDDKLSPDERALAQGLFASDEQIAVKASAYAALHRARKALQESLEGDWGKGYFRTNRNYFLPGLGVSLLSLILVATTSNDTGLAIFMMIWLSIWTAGCAALGSAVFSSWRSVAQARGGIRKGLGILPALLMTAFAVPFLVGEVVGLWFLSGHSAPAVVVVAMLLLLNPIFFWLLEAPTLIGRRLMDQIEGFRLYLSVAERERMALLDSPERTPELFEKYLPYALALGVDQKWSEQFADVMARTSESGAPYSPTWYSGGSWHHLGAAGLASQLGGSLASSISSSSTSSGSSSGSSGGGSSGGGGGGGGGGGW